MSETVINTFIFSIAAAFDRGGGTTVTKCVSGVLMAASKEAAYRLAQKMAYARFAVEDGWYARSWDAVEFDAVADRLVARFEGRAPTEGEMYDQDVETAEAPR